MTISTLYLFGLAFDIITFATLPLYILVLVTLIKFRKDETLKHSFFALMISIGIADIGTILEVSLLPSVTVKSQELAFVQ